MTSKGKAKKPHMYLGSDSGQRIKQLEKEGKKPRMVFYGPPWEDVNEKRRAIIKKEIREFVKRAGELETSLPPALREITSHEFVYWYVQEPSKEPLALDYRRWLKQKDTFPSKDHMLSAMEAEVSKFYGSPDEASYEHLQKEAWHRVFGWLSSFPPYYGCNPDVQYQENRRAFIETIFAIRHLAEVCEEKYRQRFLETFGQRTTSKNRLSIYDLIEKEAKAKTHGNYAEATRNVCERKHMSEEEREKLYRAFMVRKYRHTKRRKK